MRASYGKWRILNVVLGFKHNRRRHWADTFMAVHGKFCLIRIGGITDVLGVMRSLTSRGTGWQISNLILRVPQSS